MSNTSEATTTARDQEEYDDQKAATSEQAEGEPTAATSEQRPEQRAENDNQAGNNRQAGGNQATASEPKPDLSDQDYKELLPKLLSYFHNNREELARAIGLHRSTVDRWLNGKSRPNNSTVLRMRRLAQERGIE
jgi:hypothetical protein